MMITCVGLFGPPTSIAGLVKFSIGLLALRFLLRYIVQADLNW